MEDVHWAGATMWIAGDAIMFAFIMLVVLMWSRDDRARDGQLGLAGGGAQVALRRSRGAGGPAAARPGHGGIDDEEHLAAYNAYLARLHGPGTDKTG